MNKVKGAKRKAVTDYWREFYVQEVELAHLVKIGIKKVPMCSLCGNTGVINTIGVKAPCGDIMGRKNWCICPNGQQDRSRSEGKLPE